MEELISLSTVEGQDIRILKESTVKYRDIGAILLKDGTGAVVETIREAALGDPAVAVRKIYEEWIQKDEDHSWKKLVQCFRKVQLNSLARAIEEHFGLPSPSDDQSMVTFHSKLHVNEHILFLLAGAQAQPSQQEMKENSDERDSGTNSSKDNFTFNNLYFQKLESQKERHRNHQLHKEKDLVVLLGSPQDIQEQVLVRVCLLPCSLLLLSLIGHLAILAGLEAQSPNLETQSESVDRERHTEPDSSSGIVTLYIIFGVYKLRQRCQSICSDEDVNFS